MGLVEKARDYLDGEVSESEFRDALKKWDLEQQAHMILYAAQTVSLSFKQAMQHHNKALERFRKESH